jgi:hypothetical protein
MASVQLSQEINQQILEFVSLRRGEDVGAMRYAGKYLEGFRLRTSFVKSQI